jgi:glycosyltransferase involved in cell wall biosynthesis
MPRVLFCTDTYPPQVNGVSVVTAGMVSGLHQRGWECAVLGPSYPLTGRRLLWPPDVARGFEVPAMGLPSYPDVRVSWPSSRLVRSVFDDFQPDLVHCATEFSIGFRGMQEARKRGIPVCSTSHTDFSRYCGAYGVPFLRPVVRRWMREFHDRAVRTLVPSRAAQDDLRQIGVQRTMVWGGGVDADLFHPRYFSSTTRHRLGIGRAFTFLHVGRLAPEKNVELVLSAFSRARLQLPDMALRLIVAGAGPSEQVLRSYATHGVTFLGAVDRTSELPSLYASVDAFVTASTTETLGLVTLEAMASGLPVVACREGGLRDYLEHAHNGLAFVANDVDDCASAMVRLVSDASLQERLRSGARQTAEIWSSSRELDRIDELFRGEITARARAPMSPHALIPHVAR